MLHVLRVVLVAAALAGTGLVLGPAAAQAQNGDAPAATDPGFEVKAEMADAGAKVWQSKQCAMCHSIGKGRRAGPDLAGLVERRELEWVRSFLMNTNDMLNNDPLAKQLLKEHYGVRMPDFKLSADEAESLIHYLAREGGAGR